MHAESTRGWVYHQHYDAEFKFRGTIVVGPTLRRVVLAPHPAIGQPPVRRPWSPPAHAQIEPKGIAIVEFENGDRFSWVKPTTVVHNVFLGRLWVEQVRSTPYRHSRTPWLPL
jgi:hypothetical protein